MLHSIQGLQMLASQISESGLPSASAMSGLKNEVQNGVRTPFWTSFFNSISAAGEPIPAVMKPFLKQATLLYRSHVQAGEGRPNACCHEVFFS